MIKYLKLLTCSVCLTTYSFSAESTDQQISQLDPCLQACHNYYNQKGNLSGFTYYTDAFTNRDDKSMTKQEFYARSSESLNQCYSASNALYGACKSAFQSLTSMVTNNPNLIDMFSSCKKTCSQDLENFNLQNEPAEMLAKNQMNQNDNPFSWIDDLNKEDKYKVIFKHPFSTQEMTGQEIQNLSLGDKGNISQAIALDRITLIDGSHYYVNPETTYRVGIKDSDGITYHDQTGEKIANSTNRYVSIVK